MHYLKQHEETIRSLLDQDTESSLVYAALEARMAIERACYERLRIAHKYISAKDLRRWQPGYVITQLIEEVDQNVASGFTLSIAPGNSKGKDEAYKPIGTQVGFDPKKLSKLWQALGSYLHIQLPTSNNATISRYPKKSDGRRKIAEALEEIDRLSEGTLTATFVPECVSFNCNCGQLNRRSAALLKHKQVINCINPDCMESYTVEIDGEEIGFRAESFEFDCGSCGAKLRVARNAIDNIPRRHELAITCAACENKTFVAWRPMRHDQAAN